MEKKEKHKPDKKQIEDALSPISFDKAEREGRYGELNQKRRSEAKNLGKGREIPQQIDSDSYSCFLAIQKITEVQRIYEPCSSISLPLTPLMLWIC